MRRAGWIRVGLLVGALLLVAGGIACSLLAPDFSPAIATDSMRREGIESRRIDWSPGEGPPLSLHFVTAGAGAARMLFIHGSPGTWEAYRGYLADPALRASARLIALDRPGFGGSARGRPEPSLELQAAAAAAVLEAEPGLPALVVGHSLGGPIAARLAVDRPELVGALLLVAPSIDPGLERHRWYNVAGSWRVVQIFLSGDMITSNRELWPLRGELEALAPGLAGVDVPVTVIQGEEDDLVPPANADFARRAFSKVVVDVKRVPDEGHFVLWTRPQRIRDALLELLDGMSAGGERGRD